MVQGLEGVVLVSGVKLKEKEAVENIKNICSQKGYELLGFKGGSWLGAKNTYLILECLKHKVIWDTTSYIKFVKCNRGCFECGIESRAHAKVKTISDTLDTFKKRHGNRYLYDFSKFKTQKSKIDIFCTLCEDWVRQTADNHSQGKGCPCNKSGFTKTKPSKIYLVLWSTFNDRFLKVGITNRNVEDRVLQQSRGTVFTPKILREFNFLKGNLCSDIEAEIKSSFESGIVTKQVFPDGYTETFHIEDYHKILKLIETRINQKSQGVLNETIL